MLLRLRVTGFKNLRDIEVRFGPLTCLVGKNAAGKSNLLDAIQFLRLLADADIQGAAEEVRSPARGAFTPRELFWDGGDGATMSFEADLLVPPEVVDDFGVTATAATTLLRYYVEFQHVRSPRSRLELVREELAPLQKGDAKRLLGFKHERAFRESVVLGRRQAKFISTEEGKLSFHGDKGRRGPAALAESSPRTLLGGTNTAHYPTVLAARREISSWHSLHLEPSALRSPDSFAGPGRVDERGAHIASTLHRLQVMRGEVEPDRIGERVGSSALESETLGRAASNLSNLVPGVVRLRLDEDLQREQRTIEVQLQGSDRWFGPRALSDGTLRFLALVTMEMDPDSCRVLCMEEPENGIHPSHVPDMVRLLQDMAVDPRHPVNEENAARQVVIATHSPDVVRQLDARDIIFVDNVDTPNGKAAWVRPVSCRDNWREGDAVPLEALASLIGGAPICEPMSAELEGHQLKLELGTAT